MGMVYQMGVGYQSGSFHSMSQDELWNALRSTAIEVADNPQQIADEASRFNVANNLEMREDCLEVANTYKPSAENSDGNPLVISDKRKLILVAVSGGGEYRFTKEQVARAFFRMLLMKMHEKGIEVNLMVS